MAAVTNPFTITYLGTALGGSSDYQLLGPYVLDKSFETMRVVFDVVVVGTSYADLQTKSDALETAMRARAAHDDTLLIDLDGSVWTYTNGTTVFNMRASCSKSGNPDTDKGYSRAYTISIEAELPADDSAGLRDLEVQVAFEASRQRTVTMRGTYTGLSAADAVAQYTSGFDTEADNFLDAVGASPVAWELVAEDYSYDRNKAADGITPFPHICNFTRQYVELLADQSQSLRDDPQIKDHRMVFTDLSQHPGDSQESKHRLRRVVGSFDCAVDIEQTTDLQSVYETKIKTHIKETFRSEFSPQVFAFEDVRLTYDETTKRLSVALQFLYQKSGGDKVVEVSQSVAFRESRTIDYTFTHDPSEFAAEADVGFAVAERIWNRTVIVLGDDSPKLRIAESPIAGDAGPFSDKIGGHIGPDAGRNRREVSRSGWNIVSSTSQATPRWIGDPDDEQIKVTVLTETVIERFNSRSGQTTSVTLQKRAATTPKKN